MTTGRFSIFAKVAAKPVLNKDSEEPERRLLVYCLIVEEQETLPEACFVDYLDFFGSRSSAIRSKGDDLFETVIVTESPIETTVSDRTNIAKEEVSVSHIKLLGGLRVVTISGSSPTIMRW